MAGRRLLRHVREFCLRQRKIGKLIYVCRRFFGASGVSWSLSYEDLVIDKLLNSKSGGMLMWVQIIRLIYRTHIFYG